MAYIALYRKYRPQKFSDVVGQEHIEKTLKNQIINNRIGHAYLFSGGRGSGKTSTAKILARAVNCLNPVDGEPCNECEICKNAINGSLVDIVEMDAASNNGVDNIRDIREEVEFIPTSSKYKVYIIDEVHMLSTGAFNALLKTLEEPPAHVIFILATTEPQKLPATILSRCQRFDFKRLSPSNIMKRLKYICEDSNIKIEENALRMISNLADGAMRDAISILDRCVSDGEEIITEEKIRELSGVPEFEYLYDITKYMALKNQEELLKVCSRLVSDGKDVNFFIWELIKFQRDIAMFMIDENLINYSEDEKQKISELSKLADKKYFLDIIAKLSELQNSMKWATERSIIFEAGLIRLCSENVAVTYTQPTVKKQQLITENANSLNADLGEKVLAILKENGKVRVHADLLSTKIELQEDGIVHIIFNGNVPSVAKTNFQKDETKIAIKSAVQKAIGKDVSVKYDNFK